MINGNLSQAMDNQQTPVISIHNCNSKFFHNNQQQNIIQKCNILEPGLNYLVPQFWYQELISLNENNTSYREITVPCFQQLNHILQLYGYQKPSQGAKYNKTEQKIGFFETQIINKGNYSAVRTQQFGSITNQHCANDLQWKIIGHRLWRILQKSVNDRNRDSKRITWDQKVTSFVGQEIQTTIFPHKLGFWLPIDFISERKQKSSVVQKQAKICFYKVNYRKKVAFIKQQTVLMQAKRQLKKMTKENLNIYLLIKKDNQYKKINLKGKLYRQIHLKELLKRTLILQEPQFVQKGMNFYFYNKKGQQIQRPKTIQFLGSETFVASTEELIQIIEYNDSMRKNIQKLGDKIIHQRFEINQKSHQSVEKVSKMIQKFLQNSYKKQYSHLYQSIEDLLKIQTLQEIKENRTEDQIRDEKEQLILTGTFYRQKQLQKISSQEQKISIGSESHNIGSFTTTLDSPQGFGIKSDISYQSDGDKEEKKRKYRQRRSKLHINQRKKRKNRELVVEGNAIPRVRNQQEKNQTKKQKRLKYSPFHQILKFKAQKTKTQFQEQIQMLRKLAINCIKKIQKNNQFEPPLVFFSKNEQLQNQMNESLEKISRQILRPYYQKESEMKDEKLEKSQYIEVSQLMDNKKDQQINTIVDNNQANLGQVEKNFPFGILSGKKVQLRRPSLAEQQQGNTMSLRSTNRQSNNRELHYLSDGNSFQDNEETN